MKLKVIITFIVLLMLTGCSLNILEPEESQQSSPEKIGISSTYVPQELTVVGLGDSLTEGIGDELEKGGYFGRVVEEMTSWDKVDRVNPFNFAKKGKRSEQLLEELEDEAILEPIRDADIIFITIGGNDIMNVIKRDMFELTASAFEQEKEVYEQQIRQIVEKIRQQNDQALVVFTGLYNPLSLVTTEENEFSDIVRSWNEATERITENDPHACFAEVEDVFYSKAKMVYHTDYFHPNALGYNEMGAQIAQAVLQCDDRF